MSTAFAEEHLSMKKIEQRTSYGAKRVRRLEYQRFMPTEITFIFRKIEGYTPIPVDRLADENLLVLKIFEIRYRAKLAAFGYFE